MFEAQDCVGAQVVSALSIRLSANDSQRLRAVLCRNVGAYEQSVRAKALPRSPVPERVDRTLTLFETVIRMVPAPETARHSGITHIAMAQSAPGVGLDGGGLS